MIGTEPVGLRVLVERLETVAARRLASGPRSEAALARARQLADLLGGTFGFGRRRWTTRSSPAPRANGAGKSTIFNTLAGRAASPTGVLRPTTRVAVVLVHPADRQALIDGAFAGIPPNHLRFVEDAALERGLAVVDAPDIDSLEHANRALADQLVEAADLCCFVTTATRYADRVPWAVLARVRSAGCRCSSLSTGCRRTRRPRRHPRRHPAARRRGRAERRPGSERRRTAPRADRCSRRRPGPRRGPPPARDDPAVRGRDLSPSCRRRRPARARFRALAGSLAGLGDSLDRIADDVEHEAIDVEALRRTRIARTSRASRRSSDEISHGRSCARRRFVIGRRTSAPIRSPASSPMGSGAYEARSRRSSVHNGARRRGPCGDDG